MYCLPLLIQYFFVHFHGAAVMVISKKPDDLVRMKNL